MEGFRDAVFKHANQPELRKTELQAIAEYVKMQMPKAEWDQLQYYISCATPEEMKLEFTGPEKIVDKANGILDKFNKQH